MRFLVDVNASGSLAQWLSTEGHDVAKVTDRDPRMKDHDILKWAAKEHRIVVTTDLDFEEMIWRQSLEHCGVLRIENLPRSERIQLLRDVIHKHFHDLKAGAIVIASKQKIRVRKPH